MSERVAFLRVGAACLVAALAACGGGGGDSSGGSAGPNAPAGPSAPVSGSTGLIPLAPQPGATLYADATQLRPLLPGATWTYRGVTAAVADPTYVPSDQVYSNVVTQQTSGSGVLESASNLEAHGAQQQMVSASGGEVRVPAVLDLGNGHPEQFPFIELRSPVRVNDQYTLYDNRIADGGKDYDADGVNDEFDLAIYVKVVGEETLDLVNLYHVKAVRVMTTTLARARLSKSDSYTDLVSITSDNWYAPGIGLVKHVSSEPSPIPEMRIVKTETLLHWDGITRGVGYLPTVKATNPNPNGSVLQMSLDAVGFGTHALVMTSAGLGQYGWTLSTIDPRGVVTASHDYPTTALTWGLRMYRVGDGVRVVVNEVDGLKMYSYTATGEPTGAPPVLLRTAPTNIGTTPDGMSIVGASNGNVLWLVWVEKRIPPSLYEYLVATPFDAAGQQLAPSTILSPANASTDAAYLNIAGAPGHLIITWDEFPSGRRHATIDGDSLTPTIHTTPSSSIHIQRYPVATSGGSALMWLYGSGAGPKSLAGFTSDAAGEPWRSSAPSVDEETITLDWLFNVRDLSVSYGDSAIHTFQQSYGISYRDQGPDWFVSVTELTPGGGPLATQNKAKYLARGKFEFPSRMVTLTNSVLLIKDVPGEPLNIMPVWRGL